jgi:tetratricopeptide (TPR) repeat protein
MTQTGCDRKGLVVENRATSYAKLRDRYITWNEETNSYDPAVWGFGCGNLYSTVGDLFKFSKALSTNKLLSKEYMDMYLKMRIVRTRPTIYNISQELVKEFFGTYGNGFVGEISYIEDPETKEKETLYWHDGTNKLSRSSHFHYMPKDQIIIICSNCSFLLEGNEMVLKIHQLLNHKPYDHILIKNSLTQYIEEDVAMHAGLSAAFDEYHRFKDDTLHFIVPGKEYFINISHQLAEEGNLDWAIAILQGAITEFPGYWEAYDALGDTYILNEENGPAIQSFKKSLELNPQNDHALEMLKKLESK